MTKKYQVGAYYFPNFHVDPMNEKDHGKGWTEWELVKRATPRFKGHAQPVVPLWGYADEADPKVMETKISAAADNCVDFWIFDWYWYEEKTFLGRCLEKGYMGAKNNDRVKFCLMWANHEWSNIHPVGFSATPGTLRSGRVDPKQFDRVADYIIEKYFRHPSYFCVDGCPYFSVYDIGNMAKGLGSLKAMQEAFERFRKKTRAAGFKDLHFNLVVWGAAMLPGAIVPADPAALVRDLGADSVTSYVWVHHVGLDKAPYTPYEEIRDGYFKYWDKALKMFKVPYYPNVTMGWDSSPRTEQSDIWEPKGYPFTNIISKNTPAAFKKALALTREKLEKLNGPRILNINAWNEWTEGSYLEPDTKNGMGYLVWCL